MLQSLLSRSPQYYDRRWLKVRGENRRLVGLAGPDAPNCPIPAVRTLTVTATAAQRQEFEENQTTEARNSPEMMCMEQAVQSGAMTTVLIYLLDVIVTIGRCLAGSGSSSHIRLKFVLRSLPFSDFGKECRKGLA